MKKLLSLLLVLSQIVPAVGAISVPDKADLGAPISHLSNGGGERGRAGWTCSGTDTPAVTAPTTAPYEGNAFLQIDLKSTAGNYCETAFTIPSALVEMWTAKLRYKLASGALANGDIKADLIDVTNSSAVIPLAPGTLPGLSGSLWTPWQGEVQTPYNATSFKLRFTRVAGSGVIGVDALTLGPSAKSYGAPITDWKSFTPTVTPGAGSITSPVIDYARYRQDGDSIHVQIQFAGTQSTSNAFAWYFSMPSGVVLTTNSETVALTSRRTSVNVIGGGSQRVGGLKVGNSGTSIEVTPAIDGGTFTSGTQYGVGLEFTQKVVGWSSSTVMSSDADTRVVAARVATATTTATAGAVSVIKFSTKVFDTHGGYDSTSGAYKVSSPGYYMVTISASSSGVLSGFSEFSAGYGLNTSSTFTGITPSFANATDSIVRVTSHTSTTYAAAGDLIYPLIYTNSGSNITFHSAADRVFFEVKKLSGPQQIAASEDVSARYWGNAGQSVASGQTTVVIYTVKDWDTHGMYDPSTGVLTLQSPGKYRIKAGHLFDMQSWTTVPQAIMLQKKPVGGSFSDYGYLAYDQTWAASTNFRRIAGDIEVRGVTGDQFRLIGRNDEATARTINGSSFYAMIEIRRVGNY